MTNLITLCKVSDVPIGGAKMFAANEVTYGIFNVEGDFFVIDDRCPHAGASLACGIFEGEVVRCRIHHWRFSVKTGTYLDEAKPRFNVRTYPVRIVGDDVQIELDGAAPPLTRSPLGG